MNPRRILGMALRYAYLYKRSLPRAFEIVFWPVMDLLVWGFLMTYLLRSNYDAPAMVTFLLGAMIFWDILYRAQQGVTLPFLEDMWGRSIQNILISPVRPGEMLAAAFLVGTVKIMLTVCFLSLLAWSLYAYRLFDLGLPLIPFFINLLLSGWAVGMLTTALIMRWGQAAEALAWGVPFLLQPFSAVFYPLDVLPWWIQPVASLLPTVHVFEGMRAVMQGHGLAWSSLALAFALNIFWLTVTALFFRHMLGRARELGLLAKLGTQ